MYIYDILQQPILYFCSLCSRLLENMSSQKANQPTLVYIERIILTMENIKFFLFPALKTVVYFFLVYCEYFVSCFVCYKTHPYAFLCLLLYQLFVEFLCVCVYVSLCGLSESVNQNGKYFWLVIVRNLILTVNLVLVVLPHNAV